MDVQALAAYLSIHPKTVYDTLAKAPECLPPQTRIPGINRHRWLRSVVEAWDRANTENRPTLLIEENSGRFIPAIIIGGKRTQGRPRPNLDRAIDAATFMYTQARNQLA